MKRIAHLVRKKVVPVVGLVWGVAIVYYGFSKGFGDTSGSYRTGQIVAYLGGWAMAAAGLSALIGLRHREEFEW
jgi:hypothetical protein